MSRIARVFPCRTSMTPVDDLAFIDCQPMFSQTLPEIDEVHVSVAFSWDRKRGEQLAEMWRAVGVPVKVGGPAYRNRSGDFVPGLYLREGMTITSRGCPNHCEHCGVPQVEGKLRELPIQDGWNVMDDNLLACSDAHIREVFAMLARQKQSPVFSGGLEPARLKPWHADALRELHPERMYFANDTPDDYEPLVEAGKIMRAAGHTFTSHRMACYVLIGFCGDTFEKAEGRLIATIKAGFRPFAMLYRDETGKRDPKWRRFQGEWVKPQIVGTKMREYGEGLTWTT